MFNDIFNNAIHGAHTYDFRKPRVKPPTSENRHGRAVIEHLQMSVNNPTNMLIDMPDEPPPTKRRQWIKERIDELGTTQRAVGEAIGLDEKKMSEAISGVRSIKTVEVLPLSRVLQMSPVTILRHLTGKRGSWPMGEPSEQLQEQLLALIAELDEHKAEATINFLRCLFEPQNKANSD